MKTFIKLPIAFMIAYAFNIAVPYYFFGSGFPPANLLMELFIHDLVGSILTLLAAVLLSKKGKPVSSVIFCIFLTIYGFGLLLPECSSVVSGLIIILVLIKTVSFLIRKTKTQLST